MKKDNSYITKQGKILLDYLKQNSELHLTADEICDALSAYMGRATVYRRLCKLVEKGVVRRYTVGDGNAACFQYISSENCSEHYHLICSSCNTIIHLECNLLGRVPEHIKAEHGFSIDTSKTVFYGLCSECEKN